MAKLHIQIATGFADGGEQRRICALPAPPGVAAQERAIAIQHGNQARFEPNLIALQMLRVAFAIRRFMVLSHAIEPKWFIHAQLHQHLTPQFWMRLHRQPLLLSQRTSLARERLLQRQHADIHGQRRTDHRTPVRSSQPHITQCQFGQHRHIDRMADRIRPVLTQQHRGQHDIAVALAGVHQKRGQFSQMGGECAGTMFGTRQGAVQNRPRRINDLHHAGLASALIDRGFHPLPNPFKRTQAF